MKKLFFVLILGMFLVSLVSALEFDNKISYEDDDLTVVVKNAFGLKIPFLDQDLGVLELKSHTSVDEVVSYAPGDERVVMYYDFSNWSNYTNGFGEVIFINMSSGEEIKKNYSFVQWVEIKKEVENWSAVSVGQLKNGTSIYEYQNVNNYTSSSYGWIPLTKNVIVNGRVGLKTFVSEGDYIDAVWTIAGQKIDKHASWDSDWFINLTSWWNMEDTSSPVVDFQGNQSSDAVVSATYEVSGVVNNAINLTSTGSSRIPFGIESDLQLVTDRSMGCWYNSPSESDGILLGTFSRNTPGEYDGEGIWMTATALGYRAGKGGTGSGGRMESTVSIDVSTNSWQFLVMTVDGLDVKIYMNGTSVKNGTYTENPSFDATYSTFEIGGWNAASGYEGNNHALYDECFYYGRVLSQPEISAMYDSGVGTTPVSCTPSWTNTSWSAWQDTESCQTNDFKTQNRSLLQYDTNYCGEGNTTFWEEQEAACNYCSYDAVNTSWSAWQDTESCQIDDNLTQNRTLVEWDLNNASCYAVTGISSDALHGGANYTHLQLQESSCNYCSYTLDNSSYFSWANQTSCLANDTIVQNRSKIQFNDNYATCYAVTTIASDLWNGGVNITWWDTQEAACDFCTPSMTNSSWSSWTNETICYSNSTLVQQRFLVEHDQNFCGEVGNTTYYQTQEASCLYVPCVNAPTNSSWSSYTNSTCLQSSTLDQSRYLITFDLNQSYCGNFTNITYFENETLSCVYIAPVDQWGIDIDFDNETNRWLLFLSFGLAIALLFFNMPLPSIVILFVTGFLMLFSEIHWFFSIIPIVASVIIGGSKG